MAEDDEGGHDDGQGGADGKGGAGGDGGGGGTRLTAEDRESIVQEILAALRAGGQGGGGGDDGAGPPGDKPPGGGRLIDEERRMEQIVRSELAKVRTAEDVEGLKEQVKKIVERPPKRYRRITTAMWGRGDDE